MGDMYFEFSAVQKLPFVVPTTANYDPSSSIHSHNDHGGLERGIMTKADKAIDRYKSTDKGTRTVSGDQVYKGLDRLLGSGIKTKAGYNRLDSKYNAVDKVPKHYGLAAAVNEYTKTYGPKDLSMNTPSILKETKSFDGDKTYLHRMTPQLNYKGGK